MSLEEKELDPCHSKRHLSKRNSLGISESRRLIPEDLNDLKKLVTTDTLATFGNVDLGELLDKSIVSACLEDLEKKIIAAIYLNDHPNVPSIPPWEWDSWLYKIYQLEHMSPINTLWIHLVLFDNFYTYTFLRALLQSVYDANTALEYIIMAIPPGVTNVIWLNELGTRILPTGYSEPNKVQTLYLLVRQHFVRRLKIRRAVEEDNDDLVPLIHTYSERLVEHYGDFYVAEILTRHPDGGRQLIVAEYSGHAVAVFCLNESVNLDLLMQSFELVPLYGLKKPDESDILPWITSDGSDMTISWRAHALSFVSISISRISSASSDSVKTVEEEMKGEDSSEEDYSFANLSSLALLFDNDHEEEEEEEEELTGVNQADFSAVILSFDDYEMHLFADKTRLHSLSFDDLEQHFLKKTVSKNEGEDKIFFYGETNAFTLELAVSELEHEIESLHLLLEAAFECYPERDYCVLALPSTCPPTPLMNHFIKVPPRPTSTYPHELYILHRNSILSHISVRVSTHFDVPHVKCLLTYMNRAKKFLDEYLGSIARNNSFTSYVLLSENQVVGVAMEKEEDDYTYLKTHYEVSDWMDDRYHKSGSFGLLEYLILSPIFQKHTRFFLREIHRLSDHSVLFYCLLPSDSSAYGHDRPVCSAIADFIAVRPRQIPELNVNDIDKCGPEASVYQTDLPFALYLSTPRHSSIERMEVNKKIVIVGSSDTALAFLHGLLTTKDTFYRVVFTNVTIISPHGLNYQQIDNRIRDMMFVTKSDFNNRHLKLLSMKTYVNVVNAIMTGIERKNKLLIINESKKLPYDYLFLMCGEQFQKPSAALIPRKSPLDFPENVFLINTEVDAANSLSKLKDMIGNKPDGSIIVYGNALEAYCCLAALLEFGVRGKHLIFVEPFPIMSERKTDHRVSFFNNCDVDETVQAAIKNLDIKVYHSYYFTTWDCDDFTNRVNAVHIQSCCRQTVIKCIAMFMYNEKTVSARTFLALNKAGLVFDGALVVRPDCKTNDPNIYAAGTITKYSRRYYADHMSHKYFNMTEIGTKLAQTMRKKLIPFYDEDVDTGPIVCKTNTMLVPSYKKPVMNYCQLPGNLKYLSVKKPGKPIPLETAMNSDDYGKALITGNSKQLDTQGYFRLHINSHGVVETITCLAKFDIDVKNLTNIWGKHETLLNNLVLRFEMQMIKDLFEYFREPWCFAIYYDRFDRFENEIKEVLVNLTDSPGNSLIEDLMKLYKANDWRSLTNEQNESLQEKFMGSSYHSALERKLLDFIRENEDFLSMYAHREKVRHLVQGCERSPLFESQ